MIVAVYARYADFCGNVDFHLHGYYQCNTLEEAKAIFPESPLCGWQVEEHENLVEKLPTTVQKAGPEKNYK